MNEAIIAAIMAARHRTEFKPQNTPNQYDNNNTENVTSWFLLEKGDSITMKINENETILSTIIHLEDRIDESVPSFGPVWVATINGHEFAAKTFEDCLQEIIHTSHANEIQLIPHALYGTEVCSYLLLLKVKLGILDDEKYAKFMKE